jgi:anthranilate phosphoribosyltransferase
LKRLTSYSGAFSEDAARMMAETLAGMGIQRAYVVHGEPGWDEPTPVGPYHLFDVTSGSVERDVEDPADFGMSRCDPDDLIGGDPAENAEAIRRVFDGETGPHRDALVLGASLALRVTGTETEQALEAAASAIDDGSAANLLNVLASSSDQEVVGD